MAFYYKLGEIPPKRHTQFRQEDGSLYAEELVSSYGFSGIYSNLYHKHPPTQIEKLVGKVNVKIEEAPEELEPVHLKAGSLEETGKDFLEARVPMLYNNDVAIHVCNVPAHETEYYYKNGHADELLYIHDGEGELITQFGRLPFKKYDYVIIPRTTIYRIKFASEKNRLLITESFSPIETPKRYRSELGQLLEHSPFCERDFHPPVNIITEDKTNVEVKVKKGDYLFSYIYAHSPFDVVGWDGFLFPFTFSINDFEPITGRIHQPPPVHQTFQGTGYVVCSFVPRLFDYHPKSVPAPYNHSNIDSDEVLFYAEGEFMSRKGIDRGSFTLHPGGLPHGPHPGTVEASLGKKETHELAVMIDTFRPLKISKKAVEIKDANYAYSWLGKH